MKFSHSVTTGMRSSDEGSALVVPGCPDVSRPKKASFGSRSVRGGYGGSSDDFKGPTAADWEPVLHEESAVVYGFRTRGPQNAGGVQMPGPMPGLIAAAAFVVGMLAPIVCLLVMVAIRLIQR